MLFGDSITVACFNDSASGSADALGYWTPAHALLRHRFSLLAEKGVGGNTTTQMLARISADVLAYQPGWCLVQGGGNDVGQDASAATITASLGSIYATLRASGIRVIATTILPTTSASTSARKAALYDTNAWIREYAQTYPDVVLCDWFNASADPTTGDPKSGFTTDGVHPSATGAYWLGRALFNALQYRTQVQDPLPFTNADPSSILPNPMMVGDTAGLADSVTVQSVNAAAVTATQSKVARTDGVQGEWQQINASSAADGWQLSQNNSTAGSLWNVGDTVYGVCELEADSGGSFVTAGRVPFSLSILFYNVATSVADWRSQSSYTAMTVYPTERLVLRTPNYVVPASTTRVYLRAQCFLTGCDVRIGRMQIVKVS